METSQPSSIKTQIHKKTRMNDKGCTRGYASEEFNVSKIEREFLSEEQVVGQLNVGVFFFLNKEELLIYRFLPSSTKNDKKQPKGFDFK